LPQRTGERRVLADTTPIKKQNGLPLGTEIASDSHPDVLDSIGAVGLLRSRQASSANSFEIMRTTKKEEEIWFDYALVDRFSNALAETLREPAIKSRIEAMHPGICG
jgi:hypothetical protein